MKTAVFVLFMVLVSPFIVFAKGVLPVGVYLSTTGPVAAWGRLEWQGILTAHEMEPKAGGKRIKLILEDVGSKPEGSAMAVEKLADEGIKFVIGPVSTTNALAALPILKKHGIADIIPTANGTGLIKNRKLASRVCLTNSVQSRIMAKYIISNKRYRDGIVIEDITQDYSVDLAHRFIKAFKKDGGKISKTYKVQFMQNDFTALATNIKHIKPDFVYISAYYNTIAMFLRDLRSIGCKVKVFAGSAASSYALIKIAKKNAEGLEFTDDFDPLEPQNSIAKRFIKLFKEKFKRLPDSPEALAADAYLLLVKAINKKGDNPYAVAHYARNTVFNGVTGKIIISKGKIDRTIVIRRIHNGRFIPVATFSP